MDHHTLGLKSEGEELLAWIFVPKLGILANWADLKERAEYGPKILEHYRAGGEIYCACWRLNPHLQGPSKQPLLSIDKNFVIRRMVHDAEAHLVGGCCRGIVAERKPAIVEKDGRRTVHLSMSPFAPGSHPHRFGRRVEGSRAVAPVYQDKVGPDGFLEFTWDRAGLNVYPKSGSENLHHNITAKLAAFAAATDIAGVGNLGDCTIIPGAAARPDARPPRYLLARLEGNGPFRGDSLLTSLRLVDFDKPLVLSQRLAGRVTVSYRNFHYYDGWWWVFAQIIVRDGCLEAEDLAFIAVCSVTGLACDAPDETELTEHAAQQGWTFSRITHYTPILPREPKPDLWVEVGNRIWAIEVLSRSADQEYKKRLIEKYRARGELVYLWHPGHGRLPIIRGDKLLPMPTQLTLPIHKPL